MHICGICTAVSSPVDKKKKFFLSFIYPLFSNAFKRMRQLVSTKEAPFERMKYRI